MPKIVDHQQRRREIAEAAWRIALRRGLDDLTMRTVAAEAHVSTGVLAHYFADKEALILHALHTAVDRIIAHFIECAEEFSPWETLRAALLEGLPLDAERRDEWRTWLNFWALALGSPTLTSEQNRWYGRWQGFLAMQIRRCQAEGSVLRDLDPEEEATAAIAFIDGLSLQAAFAPQRFTAERQTGLLDRYLVRLRGDTANAQ